MRVPRSRILIGGAVAVFASATAFAVTSAAGATTTATTAAVSITTTKTGTALSIKARKSTVAPGRRDVISGRLTEAGNANLGRRIVELYRYNAKAKRWVPVQVRLTHRAEVVRFAVRPLMTTEYELVYHGDATLAASHSTPLTITVKP